MIILYNNEIRHRHTIPSIVTLTAAMQTTFMRKCASWSFLFPDRTFWMYLRNNIKIITVWVQTMSQLLRTMQRQKKKRKKERDRNISNYTYVSSQHIILYTRINRREKLTSLFQTSESMLQNVTLLIYICTVVGLLNMSYYNIILLFWYSNFIIYYQFWAMYRVQWLRVYVHRSEEINIIR